MNQLQNKHTYLSIIETSQTMKSTLLTFSLLLFSFTYFPLAFTETIEDINGNPVFPGSKYYILPLISKGGGGGLKLGKTGDSECPVTVLQDFSEVVRGFPVRFIIRVRRGVIFTTDEVDIEFVKKPKCAESAKWVLAHDDFPTSWVGIGDNIDAFQGKFKIETLGSGSGAYKLVYCPLFSAPPGACSDIGRYRDENGWRLVPTENDPFRVVFIDATESEKAIV